MENKDFKEFFLEARRLGANVSYGTNSFESVYIIDDNNNNCSRHISLIKSDLMPYATTIFKDETSKKEWCYGEPEKWLKWLFGVSEFKSEWEPSELEIIHEQEEKNKTRL